jgi:hypothetical protein
MANQGSRHDHVAGAAAGGHHLRYARRAKRWYRHALHCGVTAVVLVLGVLAAGFITDAVLANRTYDGLRADRVAVQAASSVCGLSPDRSVQQAKGGFNDCEMVFAYQGHTYHAYGQPSDPKVLLIDPRHPQYRMAEAVYQHGPVEITGDLAMAAVLVLAAAAVVTVHVVHIRRYHHELAAHGHR